MVGIDPKIEDPPRKDSNICVQLKTVSENAKENVDIDVDVLPLEEGEQNIKNVSLGKQVDENNINENKKLSKRRERISRMKRKIKFANNDNVFLTIYTIIGYFFTSIAIIYYNHWLFDKVAPYPVFATWIQQIVGVCCFGLASLSRKTPDVSKMNKNQIKNSNKDFENGENIDCTSNNNAYKTEFEEESDKNIVLEIMKDELTEEKKDSLTDEPNTPKEKNSFSKTKENGGKKFLFGINVGMKKLLKILPMSICFVGLVAFGNICLKYVQVSTYQLARSGSLIFTVIVSYFMLGQVQTWQSILACIVVCTGFLIGSLDRSSLSVMGIITGLASSFCQVFYNVFMKKCMNYFDGDAIELMKYNQCISTILLIPCIFLAQELNVILNSAIFDINQAEFFRLWVLLIICGLLSMLLNYFTFLVVGYTSPVTFNVLGMFKSCAQTAGGFIIFHDKASVHSVTGICLTLAGSVWYGFAKSINCKPKNKNAEENVDSKNVILCKATIDQKTSNILKELTKMEELDYSSYLNGEKNEYSKSNGIVNEMISNAEKELMILSSKLNNQKLDINERQFNHSNINYEDSNFLGSDNSKFAKDKFSEKTSESRSLSSCISDKKNEDRDIETNISTKSFEHLNLTKLFNRFAEFSREGSTELRTSMSKISVSLPASVYASPAAESRHVSIESISNKHAETPNDDISVDVSILIDSEKGLFNNIDEQEVIKEKVYNKEESDEEKSTVMATIY